jgi:hypothetical protein
LENAFFGTSVKLGATEAFAAVEAFIAGAVADGDMAAVGAQGCIQLKVCYGVAQGLDRTRAMVSLAIGG